MDRYDNIRSYCESQEKWNSGRVYKKGDSSLEFYNSDLDKYDRNDIRVVMLIEERDSRTHNIVKFKCLKCGYEYDKEYREGRKAKCKMCHKKFGLHNIKGFLKELEKEYEVLEYFIEDTTIRVKLLCKECNKIQVYRGYKIPKCNHNGKNKEARIKKLQNVLGTQHLIISEYTRRRDRIRVKCLKYNKEYEYNVAYLLNNRICPYCFNTNKRNDEINKAKEDIIEAVRKDESYEFINFNIDKKPNTLLLCKKCNMIWNTMSYDFIRGCQCPCRLSKTHRSKYEEYLCKELNELNINVKNNITLPNMNMYELDLYLPDYNIAIECNGTYYHSSRTKDRDYHQKKRKLCEENGIRLIQIWSFIKDISLIDNKLLNILGKLDNKKLYARLCKIELLSKDRYEIFMNKNHIQGTDNPKYRIALMYDENIVAAVGLSKPNLSRSSKNQMGLSQLELTRFATDINYRVPGALSKIMSYIKKNFDVDSVYSYADLDWVDKRNNVYIKTGFIQEKECPPAYHWLTPKDIVEHRFKYRKSQLKKLFPDIYDDSKTEKEMMESMGYYQIWNSGFIKYRYYLK